MKYLLSTFLLIALNLSYADHKTSMEFRNQILVLTSELEDIVVPPENLRAYIDTSNERLKIKASYTAEEYKEKHLEIKLFYSELFSKYQDLRIRYNQLEKKAMASNSLTKEEKERVSNSIKYDRDIILTTMQSEMEAKFSRDFARWKENYSTDDIYKLLNKDEGFKSNKNCQISQFDYNPKTNVLLFVVKQNNEKITYLLRDEDITLHNVSVSNLALQGESLKSTMKIKKQDDLGELLKANNRIVHKFYTEDPNGGLSKIILYENDKGIIDNAYFEMNEVKTSSSSFLGFEYGSKKQLKTKTIDCISHTQGPAPASVE